MANQQVQRPLLWVREPEDSESSGSLSSDEIIADLEGCYWEPDSSDEDFYQEEDVQIRKSAVLRDVSPKRKKLTVSKEDKQPTGPGH